MSSDRTCRTLTARQLIEKLRRVDPDLPVVFTSRDEPLGDYGVRSLEVCEMQRENIHSGTGVLAQSAGCSVRKSAGA